MTLAAALLINLAVVGGLILFFSNANRFLGPLGAHGQEGLLPYETGMPPIEPAVDKMSVLYHRFAVLFVVFDVDLAFLLPWAFNRGNLGMVEAVSITLFVGLLALMLAYFWRKGVLECR